MSGFKWLCHLSRHCLPMRPGRLAAILDHLRGPSLRTCSQTIRSSSSVHCRFWPVLVGVLGGDSEGLGGAQVVDGDRPHWLYILGLVLAVFVSGTVLLS